MKIFVCDGTPLSFFTAVFDAYAEKNCIITAQTDVQLSLDSEVIYVARDKEKCGRVLNAITKIDCYAEEEIALVLRSCDPLKENVAFAYVKKLLKLKTPVRKMLNLTEVIEFNDILYKVRGEAHRLKGFLRFMESCEGVLYAPYSPDNNVTDLLMRHFCARLSNQKFVIHDLKRKIAGIYNGREWVTCYLDEADVCLSENERAFENLWKKYYKAVNIEARPHEKQMKGYMPVRYWKFLPEKRGD